MKIIHASYEIMDKVMTPGWNAKDIYKKIERAGRTCYKSEDKITEDSAEKFVRAMVKSGHEAMLEHAAMTVKFIVDRGISHELVRHRVASFAQESSRYCDYSKGKFGNEITVIEPVFFMDIPEEERAFTRKTLDIGVTFTPEIDDFLKNKVTNRHRMYARWYEACEYAEHNYFMMLKFGAKPEEARSVLPTSLKTEVVMTANMREWRHFLKLRAAETTGKVHPQMLEVTVPLLKELQEILPALFEDIEKKKIK